MSISEAYEALANAIVADPTISRSDAGVIIEGFGPTMPGSAARQWIDAVATEWNSLGTINNPTWAALRNEIAGEGVAVSLNLFNALLIRVNGFPESIPVNAAILHESLVQELAAIPANIVLMEGFKTGNVQLNAALDIGINALQQRAEEINQQLNGI